jgi:hypothetical protein
MHRITKKIKKLNTNGFKLLGLSIISASLVGLLVSFVVLADGTKVVVTATDAQGWYSGDTQPGGAVSYVPDSTSPYPTGALALTTDATPGAKAQYLKSVNIPLADVTDLSYYTKHVSGPAGAAASFQLNIALYGIADWTTAFVYDPSAHAQVVDGTWQKWDVYNGGFWANDSVPPIVVVGAGSSPYYTLNDLKAAYPNAIVQSFGVYAGTFNPDYPVGTTKQNYNVETDGVTFNNTTYDFDAAPVVVTPSGPTSKDACKNGGWMSFKGAYTNQGQCVSSFSTSK